MRRHVGFCTDYSELWRVMACGALHSTSLDKVIEGLSHSIRTWSQDKHNSRIFARPTRCQTLWNIEGLTEKKNKDPLTYMLLLRHIETELLLSDFSAARSTPFHDF